MNPAAPHPTPRRIAVVLGSGRSGTSLLMQTLTTLGMRVSGEMIAARRDNPQGFFEDARIVRIQADLLRALGAWPYHPLPADWLAVPATATAIEALRTALREQVGAHHGLWGFKDPRTAPFLPLWQRLFAEEGIEPRYLLALRAPGKVIASFMAAYDTPAEVAEQVWLRRTSDALRHTRANCHIVHYEDWFSRPREVAQGMTRYLGLPDSGMDTAVRAVVRPELDRVGGTQPGLRTPAALTLWAALRACRGDDFDRAALLRVVADCGE